MIESRSSTSAGTSAAAAGTASSRKRAATSTTAKACAPKRAGNRQTQAQTANSTTGKPIEPGSFDSIQSWIENEKTYKCAGHPGGPLNGESEPVSIIGRLAQGSRSSKCW